MEISKTQRDVILCNMLQVTLLEHDLWRSLPTSTILWFCDTTQVTAHWSYFSKALLRLDVSACPGEASVSMAVCV